MRYSLKLVPKASPNDDGEWVDVETDAPIGIVREWNDAAKFFAPHVPERQDHGELQEDSR